MTLKSALPLDGDREGAEERRLAPVSPEPGTSRVGELRIVVSQVPR